MRVHVDVNPPTPGVDLDSRKTRHLGGKSIVPIWLVEDADVLAVLIERPTMKAADEISALITAHVVDFAR